MIDNRIVFMEGMYNNKDYQEPNLALVGVEVNYILVPSYVEVVWLKPRDAMIIEN